jgi:signal transduction histidine kinase
VPVVTETRSVGRYSPDIEVAVYFCCLEALQNVTKYAGAASARLRRARLVARPARGLSWQT